MAIVPFAAWAAARDQAAAALLGGATRLVLTGPAGTGKTALLEQVARVLRAAGRDVAVQQADAEPAAPGPGATLFVDEADRLSLAGLRRLLEATQGALVLAGLEPLGKRVTSETVRLSLAPLGQEASRSYVAQWLALNGRTPADLDSKALRRLVELSGGIPRLLNTLLSAASWLAETGGAAVVTASHVEEAAELRSVAGPSTVPDASAMIVPPRSRRRGGWPVSLGSGLVAAVVLAGIGVAVLPRLYPAATADAVSHATVWAGRVEQWARAKWDQAEPSGTDVARVAASERPGPIVAAEGPETAALRPAETATAQPEPGPAPAAADPVSQPATTAPSAAIPSVAAPVEVVPVQLAPVQLAPVAAEPVHAPEPAPAAPPAKPPEAERPVEVTSRSTPRPPTAAVPHLSAATVELLIQRGREMLALNDISAARLLFGRAAEAGNGEAMFELGRTYDPVLLTGSDARRADAAEAMRWYRRAAEHRAIALAKPTPAN